MTVAEPRHVYVMRDADRRVLYVGCTSNPPARIAVHSHQQPWWRRVATVEVEHFDSPEEARLRERTLIRALDPPFNISFRPVDNDSSIPLEERCSYFIHCGQRAVVTRVSLPLEGFDGTERRYRLCASHAAPWEGAA